MNHLLIEIFSYLLAAGAMGLLIGWVLRGDCRQKLLLNTHKWNQTLEASNEKHEHNMQSLRNKHDQYQQEIDSKESEFHQQLQQQKSLLLNQKSQYSLLQMEHKKLKLDSNLELRHIDIEWEEKLNDVIVKNDNSLQILNREIALLKKELNQERNKEIHFE